MNKFQIFYESNQIDWSSAYNFYDDGNPVEIDLGFGKIEIAVEMLENGEEAIFLNDMFIHPEYQGMGHASQILKSLTKYADKERTYTALRSSIGGHNQSESSLTQEQLVNFYKKYGFENRSDLSIYGDDEIFMVREPR